MSAGPTEQSRGTASMVVRVLLVVGFVIAVGATGLVVLAENVRLLRLAAVLALWAALIAAFAVARSRRDAKTASMRVGEAHLAYQIELQREVSARHEYEAELAAQMSQAQSEQIAELREQLDRLTDVLAALADGELFVSRMTLSAESARFRTGQGAVTARSEAALPAAAYDVEWDAVEPQDGLASVPQVRGGAVSPGPVADLEAARAQYAQAFSVPPTPAPEPQVPAPTGSAPWAEAEPVLPTVTWPPTAVPRAGATEQHDADAVPAVADETSMPVDTVTWDLPPEPVAGEPEQAREPADWEPEQARERADWEPEPDSWDPPHAPDVREPEPASARSAGQQAPEFATGPWPTEPALPSLSQHHQPDVESERAGSRHAAPDQPSQVSVDDLLAAYGLTGSPRRRRRD